MSSTKFSARIFSVVSAGAGVVVMSAGAILFAQGGDAAKVMADMRKALGGEQKLAAVKALNAQGKTQRASGETSTVGEYELTLEFPDKYFSRQSMAQTPFGAIVLKSGYNGDGLIQETEQPQQAGGMRMVFNGGGAGTASASPEEKAAAAKRSIASSKAELTRMALGMFGGTVPSFPLEYKHAGVAESPDGKADVIEVKGEGDFAGKLFVDQKTHMPLMFSWMAKEPMQMSMGGRAGGAPSVGGSANSQTFTLGNAGGKAPTPEEIEKMRKDMQERMATAEASRKVVEYRMFYADYQSVDGVQLPHKFQTSIAGNAATEITIEKYKVNPKIDPKKFETVK